MCSAAYPENRSVRGRLKCDRSRKSEMLSCSRVSVPPPVLRWFVARCSSPAYPYRKDVTVPSVHFFASQHHFSRGCPGALLLPRVPSLGPSVHLCVQTLLAEFRWMRISGSRRGNEGRWVVLRCGALVLFVCDSHISLLAWIRDTARDQWACVTQSVALL